MEKDTERLKKILKDGERCRKLRGMQFGGDKDWVFACLPETSQILKAYLTGEKFACGTTEIELLPF